MRTVPVAEVTAGTYTSIVKNAERGTYTQQDWSWTNPDRPHQSMLDSARRFAADGGDPCLLVFNGFIQTWYIYPHNTLSQVSGQHRIQITAHPLEMDP